MQTPGRPVSRPWVAAMKAADCSWRVSTSSMDERRSASTTSRFSSPGMPKMRSTPSFSRQRTSSSAAFMAGTPLRKETEETVTSRRLGKAGGHVGGQLKRSVGAVQKLDRGKDHLGIPYVFKVVDHELSGGIGMVTGVAGLVNRLRDAAIGKMGASPAGGHRGPEIVEHMSMEAEPLTRL